MKLKAAAQHHQVITGKLPAEQATVRTLSTKRVSLRAVLSSAHLIKIRLPTKNWIAFKTVKWGCEEMKFKTSFFTASVFIFYLGERKIYQIKKLIHCLIGTVIAVPLCCDFIIPHQYWQLCDENKNVFGIFNFIMCSNKQCILEFIEFVFKYNFCRYSRKNEVFPYKTAVILRHL